MLFYFIFLHVILKLQNKKIFFFFFAKSHGLQNLSSLTEDWTQNSNESTES